MKNIFKIFNSENLKKNLKNIYDRFPITIIVILSIAVLFFIQLHYHSDFTNIVKENMFITILSLILTFVFSIGVYLSTENSDFNKIKRSFFQIIPVIFGIGFYFSFSSDIDSFENIIFFFLTLLGIISYLFFAPYLKNIFSPLLFMKEAGGELSKSVYYIYFYNISVLILISFILGGVLFALGAIGIGAVDALFDLDLDGKNTYGNWAILSLAVITPLFTLTQIPEKDEFRNNKFNENMFFSFLVKFVAIPFITIYFLILYAYTIKVLSNFSDWPKGEVSWLVIGFSLFGYITYIFSYIFEEKNKFISIFRKAFPYIVIPQIFMLFYAIYLRINQYDVTINRYFIVVFGLWLLIISIYYIISRKKYLSVIPAVLTLFTIIISIGPWGVYSLPESRQIIRLENNLIKAKILQESKIIPLKNYTDISEELSTNIYSGIDYLCDFNNCKKIKELFPQIYAEILEKDKIEFEKNNKEEITRLENREEYYKNNTDEYIEKRIEEIKNVIYKEPSKWTIVQKITEKIKVRSNKYISHFTPEINIYGSYDNLFPLEIDGYKKIFRIGTNNRKYNIEEENKLYGKISIFEKNMEILENGKLIDKLDLTDIFKEIRIRYDKKSGTKWSQKDLIFILNNKYKIIFETIRIPREYDDIKKEDDFAYYDMYGVVLVK